MMLSKQQYILATVAYADIFDYPLRSDELRRWLIRLPLTHLPKKLTGVEQYVRRAGTYVVLPGKRNIVNVRAARRRIAEIKWRTARSTVGYFRWIPTVQLIGVTGGLSVDNARAADDIDLFFVTARRTLWVTRFMVTMVSEIMGIRRRPNERSVKNKICLNMFMAEDALSLPQPDRDLFAAHEVLQMVPLWARGNTYQKFLSANRWVRYFVPNAWVYRNHELRIMNHGKKQNVTWFLFIIQYSCFILQLFEPLARTLQLWYMQKHRTTEIIEPGILRFHPKDARVWVKKKFVKRLKRYDVPLDKVFYHR